MTCSIHVRTEWEWTHLWVYKLWLMLLLCLAKSHFADVSLLLHGALVEWGHLSVCSSPLEDTGRPACSRIYSIILVSPHSVPPKSHTQTPFPRLYLPSSSEMVSNAWKFNLLSPIHRGDAAERCAAILQPHSRRDERECRRSTTWQYFSQVQYLDQS